MAKIKKIGIQVVAQFFLWLFVSLINCKIMSSSSGESHGLGEYVEDEGGKKKWVGAKEGYSKFLGDACWFTLVTQTTVGYGDINAITIGARWMAGIHMVLVVVVLLGLDVFLG